MVCVRGWRLLFCACNGLRGKGWAFSIWDMPASKLRVVLHDGGAIKTPAGTAPQVGWGLVRGGAEGRDYALECGRGHVVEQLAHVGAARDASQIGFDGFAPSTGHAAAHHALHGIQCGWAALYRVGLHASLNRLHHQLCVDGDTNQHVVDGVASFANSFAVGAWQVDGFGIQQLAFDVPQAIFTFKAAVINLANVLGRACDSGLRQGHMLLFLELPVLIYPAFASEIAGKIWR